VPGHATRGGVLYGMQAADRPSVRQQAVARTLGNTVLLASYIDRLSGRRCLDPLPVLAPRTTLTVRRTYGRSGPKVVCCTRGAGSLGGGMRETVRLGRLLPPTYPGLGPGRPPDAAPTGLPGVSRRPSIPRGVPADAGIPPRCTTRYLPGSHPPSKGGLLLVRRLPPYETAHALPRRPPPRLPGALRPPAWPGRPPASRPDGLGRQSPDAGEVAEAARRELPPVPPAS
jgi:hypothetical protein